MVVLPLFCLKIMKMIKKMFLIIMLAFIPAKVSATVMPTPIPMPIPIYVPSDSEIEHTQEFLIKSYDGVYKLGKNPLVIGLSEEDYPKIKELAKEKKILEKSEIFRKTLSDAREKGNVVVYEPKSQKGFEVPEQELNEFMMKTNLKNDLENQPDIVEIWETDKTEVVKFKTIEIEHSKIDPLPIDVPEEKTEEIKNKLQDMEKYRKKPLKRSKLTIHIEGNSYKVTEEELKEILNIINTYQSQSFMEFLNIRLNLNSTIFLTGFAKKLLLVALGLLIISLISFLL